MHVRSCLLFLFLNFVSMFASLASHVFRERYDTNMKETSAGKKEKVKHDDLVGLRLQLVWTRVPMEANTVCVVPVL